MADRQNVLVVTDSTADIPRQWADDLGIVVVPLTVMFGTESFRDGIDLSPTEFLDRLREAPTLPTTSQPPVTAFETVFRDARERGQDVVCVTISADLSGTHNAARLAADAVDPERIR
ncbi:MAG: DegV family EDD domain-containing protein, partial [Chloroflexia bacterium]|nr:DegV family EDD domain-containing protein [Chloroflexia bacterium]